MIIPSRYVLAATLSAVVALVGCRASDPHQAMIVDLAGAYGPYRDCVVGQLRDRDDFAGRLGELVVEKSLDARLREARLRYLGAASAPAPLPADAGPDERAAAADADLVALSAYASSEAPGAPIDAATVRRQMAVVDSLEVTALATGVACEYPNTLKLWMEKATHEYL